jgi:hypothetical protein
MTPQEALAQIQAYARKRQIWLTEHVCQRMHQRNVRMKDIYSAINTAHLCEKQEDDKWKVTGQDLDNEELTLIIAIDGMNVIVTLY